jgi:hypothetical protein
VPPVAAEQHPPLHGATALHAVAHAYVIGSHAWPEGQSCALSQPHAFPPNPTRHSSPPPHVPHVAWPSAHASGWSPGTHSPPEQHPPLHVASASQVTPHSVFVHAEPAGQSLLVLQPHDPSAWHTGSTGSLVQSLQKPPPFPQASDAWPGWQVVPSQHPPLQTRSARLPAHDVVHVDVVGSHA